MSQGQDGGLYGTDLSNGAHNFGSVYKMTTAGQYTPLYSSARKPAVLMAPPPMAV